MANYEQMQAVGAIGSTQSNQQYQDPKPKLSKLEELSVRNMDIQKSLESIVKTLYDLNNKLGIVVINTEEKGAATPQVGGLLDSIRNEQTTTLTLLRELHSVVRGLTEAL